MMRRIAFFEDAAAGQFTPLTLLRPVFELLCGHFCLRERLLQSPAEWGAFVRPWLAAAYREEHTEAHVNDTSWLRQGPTLLINGRWLPDGLPLPELRDGEAGFAGDTIACLVLAPEEAQCLTVDGWNDDLTRLASGRRRVEVGGTVLRYPWDLLQYNPRQIGRDFRSRDKSDSRIQAGPQVAIQGNNSDVYVAPSAQIDSFVVIDARHGPVWIDAGVRVQPFTRIEGPAFVGRETQLFRAHVREGTSIGPVCRVGGEIEESIIHGYVNKYHDGFLGHSYVCPWVNLGALTTNSDLKNDYTPVRVPLWGEPIDTGSTKVGCFIGDHTKTALASLFNTGTSVGVMTMILPGGELLPKHVPSFSRVWHGRLEEWPDGIEAGLASARTAMARRKRELTPAAEQLLRHVHAQTQAERAAAIARAGGGTGAGEGAAAAGVPKVRRR
jgi:UDP-N-acetylglucosamine diphosphorylase/glucosamine-1-phosphate N-acetyltransferase